jgi:hypothetical protein
MSSTVNVMRRMPSVFAGAFSGSALTAVGVWNLVSSSRPWPSGVRIIAMSTRTSSSPTTRSTQRPSTGASPLQLHTKFDKERNSSLKVVDNDADVVHPLNRHTPEHSWPSTAAIRGCRALRVRARVEAHRMATGPLPGRGEDAESIEDNRFISPTDTRGA